MARPRPLARRTGRRGRRRRARGAPAQGRGRRHGLEDALALAESLEAAPSVEAALEAYVARRRPRVEWVQEQSRIAARAWVLPPEVRDQALRERGDQMLRDRYAPLVAAP